MSRSNGFSLIELMVVIAIVSVLAAIALPSYNLYVIRAKTVAITKVIDNIVDQSIVYSQVNGHFPNAYDLGLSSTPGYDLVDNPAQFLPASYVPGGGYIFGFYDNSASAGFTTPCGSSLVLQLSVDPYALGMQGVTAPGLGLLSFLVYIYNINGILTYVKYYYFTDGAVMLSSDFVSGWTNYMLTDNIPNQDLTDRINLLESTQTCQ